MSIQISRDYTRQEAIETVLDAQEQLRNIIGSLKDVFSEDDWVMSYLIAPLAVVTDEDHGYLDSSKNLGDLLQMLQDDDADDNLSNDDDPDDDDPDDDDPDDDDPDDDDPVPAKPDEEKKHAHIQGVKGGAVHDGYFSYGRWWTICGAGRNEVNSRRRRTIYQNVGCAEVTCERCKAKRQEAPEPAPAVVQPVEKFKVGDRVQVVGSDTVRVIAGVYGFGEAYTLRTIPGAEACRYAPDALVAYVEPKPEDELQKVIDKYTARFFTNADPNNLTEDGFGILIAKWARWDGGKIARVLVCALEDANYHTEAGQIAKMFAY